MPNNNIEWGQGSVNNSIGWGSGAAINSRNWGWVHSRSYGHDETNLVGAANFFNLFGTPAAGYSLRDLSRTNPDLIEVRKSYDDSIRAFKEVEILDGSLAAWVNSNLFSFTDDFSGGSTTGLTASNTTLAAPASIGGQTDAMSVTLTGGSGTHDFKVIGIEQSQLYNVSFE